MRLSKEDIKSINKKRSAIKGRIYSSFEGGTFVGQADGSLLPNTKSIKEKKYDADISTRLDAAEADIDNLEEDIVLKEYTTDVDAKLKALECKLLAFNIVMG